MERWLISSERRLIARNPERTPATKTQAISKTSMTWLSSITQKISRRTQTDRLMRLVTTQVTTRSSTTSSRTGGKSRRMR